MFTSTGTAWSYDLDMDVSLMNAGPLSTPYKCRNCGDEGRIMTTMNRPRCPNGCGRFMKLVRE